MKKPAFVLLLLWSYLLIVSSYGLASYSGAGMKGLGAWQLVLFSAAIIPIIAFLIISSINSSYGENAEALEFVSLNKKQLKMYAAGVLLLLLIIGIFVMMVASVWAVLVNAFVLIKSLGKKQ